MEAEGTTLSFAAMFDGREPLSLAQWFTSLVVNQLTLNTRQQVFQSFFFPELRFGRKTFEYA